MDGEISSVVFSPNDISGLRRPKNIKFGTKVASSIRMMCALRFWKKFFSCGKTSVLGYFWHFLQNANFSIPLAQWRHIYAETAYTWRHRASGFYTTCYLRQCGVLRTL